MDRRQTRPGVLHWTPTPVRESASSTLTSDDSWEEEDNDEEEEDDFFKEMNEDGIIGLSEALEEWELGNPSGDPCSPEDTVPSGGNKDSSLKSSGDDFQLRTATAAENPESNCLVSESTSSFSPHLAAFTEEELTATSEIEGETLPDAEVESSCSRSSMRSSPPRLELKLRGSPQPAVASSEQENIPSEESEKQKAGLPPGALKSRTCSLGGAQNGSPEARGRDRNVKAAGARSNPAGMNELRRASLSHQTLNFSKVEPRIHFPKQGYQPPKGRKSLEKATMSPQPPIVFKSPADIVQEVLFNSGGSSYSSDSNTPTQGPNSTVPLEFRCRQQATTLLQQLQEDYDRLLTKYAEAENTIDRLRLEAKVNLDSEPPKAGHAVPAGLNQKASYAFKMDLFHPHRATTCSPGRASRQEKLDASSLTSDLGQQLSNILFAQSDKFLQQVQIFEDLFKKDDLASLEELKRGVSQLYEGLNSLERGYLLARDEHKLLQQRGQETRLFDPERKLESLIFQCGLRMEDLKEQVEQIQQQQLQHQEPVQLEMFQQNQTEQAEQIPQEPIQQESIQQELTEQQEPIPEQLEEDQIQQEKIQQQESIQQEVQQHKAAASCCSSPPGTSLSDVSEGEITQTQPQSPSLPSQTDSVSAAEPETTSACKNSEQEAQEDFLSRYLRSLTRRGKRVEFEPTDSVDYCQTRKECFIVPKPASSLPSNPPVKHGGEKEEQKGCRNGNAEVQETFAQSRKVKLDVVSLRRAKTSLPSCSPPSTPPAASARSRKRLERSSSLSSACSLADAAPEWRSCKVETGSRRVPSQDRISPETDSGFMGSESSHQIPGVVPLRYHQVATESVSDLQDRSPNSPLSASQPDTGPGSGTEPGLRQRRRSRQRRRTFSPQSSISQRKQARADAKPSDLWTLFYSSTSNARSVSEEQRSVRSAAAAAAAAAVAASGSLSSSPPPARRRHGDPPRGRSSSCGGGGGGNPIDAFLILQAEVNRLKEKLEISRRYEEPLSSTKNEKPLGAATTSAQKTFCRRSSPSPIRSTELCSDVGLERKLVQTFDDVEPETLVSHRTRETRGAAAPKQQNLFFRGSEPEQLQSQVSRFTQTSLAPPNVSTSDVRSRKTQTWMSSAPEAADKPDGKDQSPLCPQCLSILRQPAQRPPGGSREPSDPPCWYRCHICGLLKMHKCKDSDCYRYFPSSHVNQQPSSPDRTRRSSAAAVSPSTLNQMPLHPQQLQMPSKPRCSSADMSPGHGSGLWRPRERKSRRRRSYAGEGQASLDGSLERAIRAARRMKHTSRHMAHSLASGLVYQKLLTQSCYY